MTVQVGRPAVDSRASEVESDRLGRIAGDDAGRGLVGVCDFFLARSGLRLIVEAPVPAIVEAKRGDLMAVLGRRAAELIAARIDDERDGRGPATLHGAVTAGSLWRFLVLRDAEILVDRVEHPLGQLGEIPGILDHCMGEAA